MRKSCFLLAMACLAPAAALADNGAFGNLSTVTSTGALGNLSTYIGVGDYFSVFNTDNGNLYSSASGGFVEATLPFTTVQQYAGGPTLHVFNFANFDSGYNANYTIVGSEPAVIAATGNITIAANVKVTGGGGAGGLGGFANYPTTYQNNGYSGGNPGGGTGGQGPGVFFGGIAGGYSGGPGGGGGSVSPGQSGGNGTYQTGNQPGTLGYSNAGGAGGSPQDTSVLQGGGGGGGGAGGYFPGETDPGAVGGAGGGGLFFITPGNFTINNGASLHADGGNGGEPNESGGSSGGGAGGELWFDIGQTFDNEGTITAQGGTGGNPYYTGDQAGRDVGGSGSGGELVIDPSLIINNGTLNVSDGNGTNTMGGDVELLADTVENNGSIIGEVPEPSLFGGLIPSLAGLLVARRRKA